MGSIPIIPKMIEMLSQILHTIVEDSLGDIKINVAEMNDKIKKIQELQEYQKKLEEESVV